MLPAMGRWPLAVGRWYPGNVAVPSGLTDDEVSGLADERRASVHAGRQLPLLSSSAQTSAGRFLRPDLCLG